MKSLAIMHILGTLVSFIDGIPAILKNIQNRHKQGSANPLNNLSIFTVIFLILGGYLRLPNTIRGLLGAIKDKNSDSILRFSLISFGTFFVGTTFYIIIVLMAIYRDDKTESQKKSKKIARIFSIICTGILIFNVSYFIRGLIYIK